MRLFVKGGCLKVPFDLARLSSFILKPTWVFEAKFRVDVKVVFVLFGDWAEDSGFVLKSISLSSILEVSCWTPRLAYDILIDKAARGVGTRIALFLTALVLRFYRAIYYRIEKLKPRSTSVAPYSPTLAWPAHSVFSRLPLIFCPSLD